MPLSACDGYSSLLGYGVSDIWSPRTWGNVILRERQKTRKCRVYTEECQKPQQENDAAQDAGTEVYGKVVYEKGLLYQALVDKLITTV